MYLFEKYDVALLCPIIMKLLFLFTGKTAEKPAVELLADYKSRISRYISIDVVEIKTGNEKSESVQSIKEKEQREQLKYILDKDFLVLLDERGKEYTSVEFAKQLEKWMASSGKRIVFLTGGAYGFSDSVMARANLKISFSKFTFTHQLIRIILLEQIYRAFTIINNQKYHH